jgi:hypothetical protein
MKNVVVCHKHFFGYFNALETNGAMGTGLKGSPNFVPYEAV